MFRFRIGDDLKFRIKSGYVQQSGGGGGGGEIPDDAVRSDTIDTLNLVTLSEYTTLKTSGKIGEKCVYIIVEEAKK